MKLEGGRYIERKTYLGLINDASVTIIDMLPHS